MSRVRCYQASRKTRRRFKQSRYRKTRCPLKQTQLRAINQDEMKQQPVTPYEIRKHKSTKKAPGEPIRENPQVMRLVQKLYRPRPRSITGYCGSLKRGMRKTVQEPLSRVLYEWNHLKSPMCNSRQASHEQHHIAQERTGVGRLALQPNVHPTTLERENWEMHHLALIEDFLSQRIPGYVHDPVTIFWWMRARLSRWEKLGEGFPDNHDFQFPPENVLDAIGIRATRVDTTTQGAAIRFNPCFFLPHHEVDLLLKYPADSDLGIIPPGLSNFTPMQSFGENSCSLARAQSLLSHVEKHFLAPRFNLRSDDLEEGTSSLLDNSRWR